MASFQPDADNLDEEVDVYNRAPDHGYEDFSTEEGPCAEQPTPDPMRSTHAQASWLAGDPPQGLQSEGDFASSESNQLRQGAQISGNMSTASGLAHRGTAWFTNADNAQDADQKASSAVKADENAHLTAPHISPNRKFSYDPSEPSKSTRSMTVVQDPWHITLVETPQGSNERAAAFCTSLTKIKSRYPHSEQESNPGMIWSRITQVHKKLLNKAPLTVWVLTDWLPYQLMYTTRPDRTVQNFIEQIIDDMPVFQSASRGQYVLKLCHSEEFLQNAQTLESHETIQMYQKLNTEIELMLMMRGSYKRHLARTQEDDRCPFHLNQLLGRAYVLNTSSLIELIHMCPFSQFGSNVKSIIKEAQTICTLLSLVETNEITNAIEELQKIQPRQLVEFLSLSHVVVCLCVLAVVALSQALCRLIQIYFRSFNSDFQVGEALSSPPQAEAKHNPDPLRFTVHAAYRLPLQWTDSFEYFSVSCSLTYAGKELCKTKKTEKFSVATSFFYSVKWNKKIRFPVEIRSLPCEAMLILRLFGSMQGKTSEPLAWAALPLYTKQMLVHDTTLISMVQSSDLPQLVFPGAADSQTQPAEVILQLDFPGASKQVFERPAPAPVDHYMIVPGEELVKKICQVSEKQCVTLLSENEKHFLWSSRFLCHSGITYLPLVLGSAPDWSRDTLPDIYRVLESWTFKSPLEALALLTPSFPDQKVREAAVRQIETFSDEEIEECLPQLVQALKFEWDLESPLVKLLLERLLKDIRVAHQLYWLLEDALDDLHYRSWYQKILAGLRFCTGNALRLELQSQRKLVNVLAEVAEKVRTGDKQKRMDILNKEKILITHYFQGGKLCSLPLNPAVVVQGVDSHECSYFTSNAAPLKVSFINANPLGKNVDVICKTGDDLRRDMLVLQFARVMNRIWLQEGLDMCMVIYRCMSTGKRTGLVEVVPDSITLATIQQERGIRGPLKDGTLKKWFHLCNKTAEDYEKALENFLHSCAGWCVVTFVLGVCDRHNDNIMLKPTGHLFHIDFAKFLGHAQRFANIKRDRAPFIFTSEMHYFLTEGGQNPQRFQRFVDLCCQAYNIIRRHTQLFMSLLELMLTAGMPELKESQDLQYVCNNLRPHESDLEATSFFTSKIKESLESVPVKLNFFIHNIAQGASIGRESKAVQPALNQTNRSIREASILGYCVKGTDILYSMQVKIENGVLMAEKTFSQFDQLHNDLQKHFVESALPQFPSWYRLSFTPKRRMKLLNDYLKELFTGPCRGSELVCRLFLDGPEQASLLKPTPPGRGKFTSHIQLCISHEDNKLAILVKHIANIKCPDGSAPDAYVKTCLLPDPGYDTKKKTGVVKHNFNPTFNMLIEYRGISYLQGCVLKVTVKSTQTSIAATNIPLGKVNLNQDMWYPLGDCSV
ncbi:hypothetical protein AOXY_G10240 [Acipenser oxyrinchus oxyrinchus]|uniref:Phosphatidylinositol-4-phosphate 3-kinase n=1 Tax=Acipenser oxyrinchus oxyrinchus TaxID=40147 RepID=A0AAD8G8I3_ACIOX|nr:hypothetical protein AOXY_G10240 [Acipenser oxyrinchus oxyrinchus]